MNTLNDLRACVEDYVSSRELDPASPFVRDVCDALPPGGTAEHTEPHEWADTLQRLSTERRKGNALCQAPYFLAEYMVNYLVPSVMDVSGEDAVFLDPSAGAGNLMIALADKIELEAAREPDEVLAQVVGIELDELTAALCRLRMACWYAEREQRWPEPGQVRVLVGDALELYVRGEIPATHGVCANPPYICPPDAAKRAWYRQHYTSAHMKYQLTAPFTEMCLRLLEPTHGLMVSIVSNGFQKREFGRKLIEDVLPKHSLYAVVDTSGAYLPGFGTPTCILFARGGQCARCVARDVLSIAGKRGEPSKPADPAKGKVWQSILEASVRARLDGYLTCSGHDCGVVTIAK